jgi:DNA-binding transcriptional LysR family regulator
MATMEPRDFSDIWAFVRVVETGSFSEAARRMGTTKANISKQVARLEKTLHAKLLHRSTRKLGLTEAGGAIFQHGLRMIEEAKALEATAAGLQAGPGGTLRVSASVAFGTSCLAGLLPAFMERYPDVRVVLNLADRYVDLVEEGIDVALRLAPRIDAPNLVARPIAPLRYVLAAAPAYLAQHGTPSRVEDLRAHRCLGFGTSGAPLTWEFDGAGGKTSIRLDTALAANSSLACTPPCCAAPASRCCRPTWWTRTCAAARPCGCCRNWRRQAFRATRCMRSTSRTASCRRR